MTRTLFCVFGVVALFMAAIGCDGPAPAPVPARTADDPRSAAIRASIAALRSECQRDADGDWDLWERQTSPYRTDLADRVRAATPYNPTATTTPEARTPVLEGRDGFPLFESFPSYNLRYLFDPESLSDFREQRPVVAATRWLRRQGIDVIFVPVPKMTEVYPERFAEGCPADRIVAPHLRRLLLELLEADVEVIDLLPLFLAERDKDSEPLYQPADPHWAPRAQTIAARAIAERLQRYDFAQAAKSAPSIWKAVQGPYPPASSGAAFDALTPTLQRRAAEAQPRTHLWITDPTGAPVRSMPSPVMVIGDSYNMGLWERLGLELNLPIHDRHQGAQTSAAFKDLVRDPALLKDCRVVVWVNCNTLLVNGVAWPLPPVVKE